ncbi:hypothetical protein QJS04_geneDACA002307 [Acorus gramineus]|uniref:GST C-terminal domain-containing protein n=1 Tax=Acorus gramineus TaxID=55184 RepID=A0AAV9A8W8_ACOGR|nr:hypothetical protein QJS04_geneDACA002307 [Acorus gramineus]
MTSSFSTTYFRTNSNQPFFCSNKMAVVSLLDPPLHFPRHRHRHVRPTPSIHRHVSPRMSLQTDPLTAITRLLWGRSLPPQLLISTVRSAWSATWHLMMRQLAPSDPSTGIYSRPTSPFRRRPPLKTLNLHLYVGLPCPWAHRTLIVRALKSLEPSLPVSVASPGPDGAWEFLQSDDSDELVPGPDRANGRRTLREVYRMRDGGYDGRSTVPMLWDVDQNEVVCNESYDIIEILNSASDAGMDLSPEPLKAEIEKWNRIVYPNVNNGVYRCGFAQSQGAYDAAVAELFGTLDVLEERLGQSRYLCGDALTLADVCLFTTLIRFDLVYNVLFKCTKKKLVEYRNLLGYTRDIYQDCDVHGKDRVDSLL